LSFIVQLEKEDAQNIRPEAFISIKQTFENAERLFTVEDDGELADLEYQLAFQKSSILKQELLEYRTCVEAEAREIAIAEEELRLEEERRRQEEIDVLEEEMRRKEAEKQRNRASGENGSHSARDRNNLPASYIVKRGETLPQIAARPEVYNDASLWQLIYKANRDQVRDPYQLWPGQSLKIPRNYSREDVADARKQAGRR